MSATSLQRMIQSKLFPCEMRDRNGIEPTDAISLISYRINFHVALHSLAENLTSDHLHYVIWINDERTFLQTLQPSEPILAFAAGHNLLRYPRVRLAAIAALHEKVSKGFDDLMHNPEI